MTITGLVRDAARAADMNLRASWIEFDIHQDRAGIAIDGEIIEQIAEIDVDGIPDGGHRGEADAVMCRPFDQSGRDRPRLRNQREAAGKRHPASEAGIEPHARHDQPEPIRPKDAQTMGAGRKARRLRERSRAMAKPGADDDGSLHPLRTRRGDDARHLGGGCGDHQHVGGRGDRIEARHRLDAIDLGMARIDQMDRPRKAGIAQVAQCDAPERVLARAGADHRDRFRRHQRLETIGAHWTMLPRESADPL